MDVIRFGFVGPAVGGAAFPSRFRRRRRRSVIVRVEKLGKASQVTSFVRRPLLTSKTNAKRWLEGGADRSFGGSSVVMLDDVTVDRGLHYFRSTASNTKRLRRETTCIFRMFRFFFCAFCLCQKSSKSSSQALGHFINDIIRFPVDCQLRASGE